MTKNYTFLEFLQKEYLTEKDIIVFANKMENAVNSFGFPKKQVCDLIFQNENSIRHFLDISLGWIQDLTERKEWQYDGRNEASVKLAREIMNGVENIFEPLDSAKIFVREANKWHRTLQQTFSGLVFCFLDKIKISEELEEISKNINKIKEKYGDKWYGLPMI